MKYYYAFVLALFAFTSSAVNVVFVNPSVPGTAFWDRVTDTAIAAANDLDIELKVVYGRDNRIYNLEAIQKVIAGANRPNYIIFMPYDGNSEATFNSLERAKIPFVTLERTLHGEEHELIGFPQENYKYWLGEIYHDNIFAGKILAEELIKQARKNKPNKALSIVGISGSYSGESDDRVLGLSNQVKIDKNSKLLQVVPAIWSRERSRLIIHQLASRFGNIDIAWTASDGMALGVMDSIQSNALGNVDIKIGGIDWTVEAIQQVKKGGLSASVGGHFMQTAWAIVKIFDHHNGKQVFKKGDQPKTYDLEVISKNNIDQYLILANKVNWHKVDFAQFSLIKGDLEQYHFSFEDLLKQLD